MADTYRISIERLENGFEVTIPDVKAIEKAEKAKPAKGSMNVGAPYTGDMTKSYAAKSMKEVLALVKTALGDIPENEYDAAFQEAAGEAGD